MTTRRPASEGQVAWVRRQAQTPVEEWVARNAHLLMLWGWSDYD